MAEYVLPREPRRIDAVIVRRVERVVETSVAWPNHGVASLRLLPREGDEIEAAMPKLYLILDKRSHLFTMRNICQPYRLLSPPMPPPGSKRWVRSCGRIAGG